MSKFVALVTGGNRGIGLEVSRQLAQRGYTVLLAARDLAKGAAAADKLKSQGLDVHPIVLDVEHPETAKAAAAEIEKKFGRLDVLVNNAGVAPEMSGFIESSLDAYRKTFEVNVFGVVATTQALLPLLRKSSAGRIVMVSSGLGSLTQNADPNWPFYTVKPAAYNASKAALNMLSVILAAELKDTPIKVNIADPGYTATELNGNRGTQTVEEGSEAIVRLATLPNDGPTSAYFDRHGPLPW